MNGIEFKRKKKGCSNAFYISFFEIFKLLDAKVSDGFLVKYCRIKKNC